MIGGQIFLYIVAVCVRVQGLPPCSLVWVVQGIFTVCVS